MKVFYYFQDLETNMFKWQRVHIIDELIRHGVEVETFNPLYFVSAEEANDNALKRLREKHYDLFFTNVCYHKMLFTATVQEIKTIGIPTICLRCDNLVIPYNDKVLAPFFDLVWLTSIETKHLYDEWGVKSFFAPYAANPYTFTYQANELIRRVCFVGTPYGSRSIMINSLTAENITVDAFCKPVKPDKGTEESNIKSNIIMPSRLSTYFSDIRYKEGRKLLLGSIANRIKGATSLNDCVYLNKYPAVKPSEISRIYSDYALCLSSTSTNHTDSLKNSLKIVNLRAFEIPMSGGITICKYNKELAEYFEDGKEIILYNDNEELVDKARYYTQIASDDEIIRMKRAARKRAENEHTWWKRFEIAFDLLGLDYLNSSK